MFVGIDESNHGRTPEIYVATYSISPRHIEPEELTKNRTKGRTDTPMPYFHLVFERPKGETHRPEDINFLATATLVTYVHLHNRYGRQVSDIYIDGLMKSSRIEKLLKAFSDELGFCPEIYTGPKLDEIYPIVNEADSQANKLYRYYSSRNGRKQDYIKTLVECDIRRFGKYL